MQERLTLREHLPLFAAASLSIPFLVFLFSQGYFPGWDESFQLNAAFRLSHGLGLTVYNCEKILHENDYRFLAEWAPGYSIVIAALLKTGLSLDIACKLFKTAMMLACLYTWFRMIRHYLHSNFLIFIFLSFVAALIILNHTSITDIVILTLFPLSTILILGEDRLRSYIWLSILLSLSVLFKYSSIFLLPAVGLWLLLRHCRHPEKMMTRMWVSLLLPVTTWFTLIIISRNILGRFTFYGHQTVLQGCANITDYLPGIFTEFFAGLTVKPLFGYITNIIMTDRVGWLATLLILIPLLPLLTWILVKYARRGARERPLVAWFLIGGAMSLLFFGLLSLKFSSEIAYPAREVRYYLFLPLLLYLILLNFPDWKKFGRRVAPYLRKILSVMTFLIFLGAMVAFMVRFNRLWKSYFSDHIVIRETISATVLRLPDLEPVALSYTSFRSLQWEDFLPRTVLVQPDAGYFPQQVSFDRTPLVFFIFREDEIDEIPAVKANLSDPFLTKEKRNGLLIAWRTYKNNEKFKKE